MADDAAQTILWKDIAATLALNGLDVLPRNARTAR